MFLTALMISAKDIATLKKNIMESTGQAVLIKESFTCLLRDR